MTAIGDRSTGPNFFYRKKPVSVTIGNETRIVLCLHTVDATSFDEPSTELKQEKTGMIRIDVKDFPDGVPTDARFQVDGRDWYVADPPEIDGGLIHVRVRNAIIQRTEARRFKR